MIKSRHYIKKGNKKMGGKGIVKIVIYGTRPRQVKQSKVKGP